MKITHMKTNHLINPLGYDFHSVSLSFVAEEAKGKYQESARICVALDEAFSRVIYDSGERKDISGVGFELPVALEPQIRYFWKAAVTDDTGERAESGIAWFETAKSVTGQNETWQAQ